ncbi:hypothetical protein LCGC14_1711620 [marine sediment metagenome]|uniref:Uncharacterized protein n=1 Tax=marine sediment metagenome TaxID=412755 RepID=A0A0F9KF04_9ZZZZ
MTTSVEKERAQNKKWRLDHPVENALKQKRYIYGYRGTYRRLKASAAQFHRDLDLTFDGFVAWRNSQPAICYYCGALLLLHGNDCNSLTIDRKNNKQGYIPGNIVLCCRSCNSSKGKGEYPRNKPVTAERL